MYIFLTWVCVSTLTHTISSGISNLVFQQGKSYAHDWAFIDLVAHVKSMCLWIGSVKKIWDLLCVPLRNESRWGSQWWQVKFHEYDLTKFRLRLFMDFIHFLCLKGSNVCPYIGYITSLGICVFIKWE